MDKIKLVEAMIHQLEQEIVVLTAAAKATYEAATHEESRPENEYDTRGLEAGYLAGAQAKRVQEMKEFLDECRAFPQKHFTAETPIALSAFLTIEHDGVRQNVILMKRGGGFQIHFGAVDVQVITPQSPLGEALMGLQKGDEAVVEVGSNTKYYEILDIC